MSDDRDHIYPEAHERDLAWLLLVSEKARHEFADTGCLPKHFGHRQIREVALAAMDIHDAGRQPTEPELADRDVPLESVLSLHRERIDASVESYSVKALADAVLKGALTRAQLQAAEHTQFSLRRGDDPLEVLAETQDLLAQIEIRGPADNPTVRKREAGEQVLNRLLEPERYPYFDTGIPQLTRGLQMEGGRFIVIAARPGMGKSVLVQNISLHSALNKGGRVAFFSFEMTLRQLMARSIQWDTKIALNPNIDTEFWDCETWDRTKHLRRVEESKRKIEFSSLVFFCDWSDVSVEKLRSDCRRMKRERGLDLIVVDYLQLMTARAIKDQSNRQGVVEYISRSLKALSGELDIPVVALSQLSREVEKRTMKRPMLSDLRQSGAIEQDADTIAMLYSDEYYLTKERKPVPAHLANVVEVNVVKQRDGATGGFDLSFQRPTSTMAHRNKYARAKGDVAE